MPRKWVYTKRGKTQLYNKTSLDDAVNAVKEGMSIRQAAKHFNVPKSTIGDRISGKHELHVPNGRPPHIPKAIEDKIVDAVKMAARRGIGLTRQQVLNRTLVLTKRMKIGGGFPNFKATTLEHCHQRATNCCLITKSPKNYVFVPLSF
jgi:hypothetical protein